MALHTAQSSEFLIEVLKWIDGKGHCKHLFHGVRYSRNSDEASSIVTGKLSKDIEAIYTQVRGEKEPPKQHDVRNALKEAGMNYDQAEDMAREKEVLSPDSLRIQQM